MAPSYSLELPIAFSKIDGFDVTPLTRHYRSAFSGRPLRCRGQKSSQTDCRAVQADGIHDACSVRGCSIAHHLPGRGAFFSSNHGEALTRQYAYPPSAAPLTTYRSPENLRSADLGVSVTSGGAGLRVSG
jgi:hypothetical protein